MARRCVRAVGGHDHDVFAGWGGLQPEGDDADVGLVLHPHYWGRGKLIFEWFVRHAFDELGLESVTTLLPPSRGQAAGLARLGFHREEAVVLDGECFTRYRLCAADPDPPKPKTTA